MVRRIAYWGSTGLLSLALLGSLTYLTGSPEVVAGFTKAGYPQNLRIVLGIAKPVAALVMLIPGFTVLKEWAYAGVTFALVMAFISAYTIGEPASKWILPPVLLILLGISYVTRPTGRRVKSSSPIGLMPD